MFVKWYMLVCGKLSLSTSHALGMNKIKIGSFSVVKSLSNPDFTIQCFNSPWCLSRKCPTAFSIDEKESFLLSTAGMPLLCLLKDGLSLELAQVSMLMLILKNIFSFSSFIEFKKIMSNFFNSCHQAKQFFLQLFILFTCSQLPTVVCIR